MTDRERYYWDLNGHLVVRNLLTARELKAANDAIDYVEDRCANGRDEESDFLRESAQPRFMGETLTRTRNNNPFRLMLRPPHCDPFRRMIGHPAIAQRLNWMLGYGFRESGEPMCCVYPKGTPGGSLHGQNPGGYSFVNGRQQVEQVNVAWALHDEVEGFGENSGGFLCVPGSHKAMYQIPRPLTTSIDLPQVYKPGLKAGDVLFLSLIHI